MRENAKKFLDNFTSHCIDIAADVKTLVGMGNGCAPCEVLSDVCADFVECSESMVEQARGSCCRERLAETNRLLRQHLQKVDSAALNVADGCGKKAAYQIAEELGHRLWNTRLAANGLVME